MQAIDWDYQVHLTKYFFYGGLSLNVGPIYCHMKHVEF